jgi:hypothetical protein
MDIIERGTRTIIRAVLRQRGIQHTSTPTNVFTICYARQLLLNVRYAGPLQFTYSNGIVNVTVYNLDDTESNHKLLEQMATRPVMRRPWTPEPTQTTTKIEVANPNFDELIAAIVDKHISDDMKVPDPGCVLHHATEWRHVPNVVLTKPLKPEREGLFVKIKRWWYGPPPSNLFYFEQAVIRYCNPSPEVLSRIKNATAIMEEYKQSEEETKRQTGICLGQKFKL